MEYSSKQCLFGDNSDCEHKFLLVAATESTSSVTRETEVEPW